MVHNLTERAPGKSALRPKNRVSGFSANGRVYPLGNRRRRPEPRRKSRSTLTFFTPGIPHWPSRDPIEEEGGVNLYGFVGNDGVDRWDLAGMLILGMVSPYLDPNGNTKSNNDIWEQLWKPTVVRVFLPNNPQPHEVVYPPAANNTTSLLPSDEGGRTGPFAAVFVWAKGCKVEGEIDHTVLRLWMNIDPNRSPKLPVYWERAHHEVMHIRALLNRLRLIRIFAYYWLNDTFNTPEAASQAAEDYHKLLTQMVNWAAKRESLHKSEDGVGTPENGIGYPGWEKGQPDPPYPFEIKIGTSFDIKIGTP